METDPIFLGWDGRSAPPPTSGGGRAAIIPRMKSIGLRLAKRRIGTHVCCSYERWRNLGAWLPSMVWVVVVLLRQLDDQLEIGLS